MPTAITADKVLREKPRSVAMGRNNGPTPKRRPTVNKVRMEQAATTFQPKYQCRCGWGEIRVPRKKCSQGLNIPHAVIFWSFSPHNCVLVIVINVTFCH